MTFLPAIAGDLHVKPHVTEQEAKAIWLEANTKQLSTLIKTLWFTGLRISEATRLKAADVRREGMDFSLIVIREKQFKANSKAKKPANPEPEKLPIPRDFGLDLYDFLKDSGIRGDARMFPQNRSTYWRQIRECARKANILNWEMVHPHSFRHGFVYDKARKGVHPYTLSKLAGHSQLRTTMEYYQPSEADLRAAMEV